MKQGSNNDKNYYTGFLDFDESEFSDEIPMSTSVAIVFLILTIILLPLILPLSCMVALGQYLKQKCIHRNEARL